MNRSMPSDHPRRGAESGVALVLGILFTIIVVGITISGSLILKAHQTKTKTSFVSHGQSVQFARSGLTEALGWFRKQTAQPVLDFEPRLDTSATPQILDTIDTDVGIVREFEITDTVWGRYEVWKDWPGDPDPDRLAWRDQMRVVDLSAERGNLSPGSVWKIRSMGYVFRLVDPSVPFDQAPNQVLGQELLEVEARRLALQPPGQAALCTRAGGTCRVLTRGRVQGNTAGAGIFYRQGTGNPTVSGTGASVTGGMSASATYADDAVSVFGVSMEELKPMADYVVGTASEFPTPVPIDTVVVSEVPMTFDASRPLSGTGVVVILGNCTVSPGSYSSFSGLLYVQGNFTLREPSEIQGAVVVTGSVTIQGASDYVTISYDDEILNHLRRELGTYRLSSAIARPLAEDR